MSKQETHDSQSERFPRYKNTKPPKRSRNPKFVQPYQNHIKDPLPYGRLNSTKKHFRLLHLLPSSSAGSLECELFESSIAKQIRKYVAVSYHWGDVNQKKSIHVNGSVFMVRKNLYDFLSSCQRRVDWSSFWIDAICINQSDFAERNGQVEIMDSIYASASQVYVWLGPSKASSDWIFDTLNSGSTLHAVSRDIRLLNAASNANKRQQLQDGWLWILQRQYWGRMWIVQEVLLAKELTLVCGDRLMSWDRLELLDDFAFSGNELPNLPGLRHYRDLRRSRKTTGLCSLESLIVRHADRSCQYKHDRIYSLLGLCNDYQDRERRALLKPNYGISLDVLFFQVMEFCAPEGPIGFGTHLATLLGITEKVASPTNFVAKDFTLSQLGTLDRRLTNEELASLSQHQSDRKYRGYLLYHIDGCPSSSTKSYALFDENTHLQTGALFYALTLKSDCHNIALAFHMDASSLISVDSVVFGLWTNFSTELPTRKLLESQKDFIKIFFNDADVELEEEKWTLRIKAKFERWLELFSVLHDNVKSPTKPQRTRRAKKTNRRLEHDSLTSAGKYID